jgi:hypothetical protein
MNKFDIEIEGRVYVSWPRKVTDNFLSNEDFKKKKRKN